MNNKEKSNNKVNEHKTETNELIKIIERIIKNISKLNPIYAEIDNAVETYRDKIYSIYTKLEKQSIDFWSDEFVVGDLIRWHLETIMYYNVENLLSLAKNICSKKTRLIFRNIVDIKTRRALKELKESNNYIKEYDINKNLYDTLIWYYNSIPVLSFKPKEIFYSYIIIRNQLNLLGMGQFINEDKEQQLIEIIKEKEAECLESREKYNQLLETLKEVSNNEDDTNTVNNYTKQRRKEENTWKKNS